MGLIRQTGSIFGLFVNLRFDKMMSADMISASWARTRAMFRSVFRPYRADHEENFDEAMERLGVTEADLQQRIKEFERLLLIFSFMALAIFSYTFSMAWKGFVFGTIMGLTLTGFCLTHVFRYHFFRYLIVKRHLGASPREWFRDTFRRTEKGDTE